MIPDEAVSRLDARFWVSTLSYCGAGWVVLATWMGLDARRRRPERRKATLAATERLRETELADLEHQHVDVGV